MARTLVETLKGDSIARDLERAYRTLARVLLNHRSRGEVEDGGKDTVSLDRAVCETEGVIDLKDAQAICSQISAPSERPGEVFNNLGHMFVLLQAVAILHENCSLAPTHCAPTQQSQHEGERIADLEGNGWALEAYGGVNYRNNSKLALDLRALSLVKPTLHRTFLAFRQISYRSTENVGDGGKVELKATCPVGRGGPFTARAMATFIGRLNGVIVLETGPISITDNSDGS